MDLRIKYLTTNVEDIMEDVKNYHTNNEKINFLLDTKSYLATIATKLESEIISPLIHYEKLFKMLPEKNEGADFILRALCSSVRNMAEDRKKVGFTDTEVYADNLLKEEIPKQAREIRAVMKFIDEQVEILEKRVTNNTKIGNYNEKKEINNNTNYKLKPFFDDRMIFQQLEKLPENKKLNFINSTLAAIDKFFDNKKFYELPIHIRLLVKHLEAQKWIYESLENSFETEDSIKKDKEKIELFDFDFIKIIDYADKLDYQKAIEYLERVLAEARKYTGFDNNLDKGLFETDLQKTICEKQFKLDITEPFNYRQFKTYDFNQQLILSYAKYVQEVKDRIKYFNFILREYDYAIKAINCHLNPENGLEFVHSDYYQIIHREAYLYARYKEDKGEGEFEKIMDLYLIDMKNRLERVAKRISEELNFSLDLLGENKNEPDKKISDEAHTSTDLTNINNELSSAQTIILKQRNTIRTLKKGITQSDLIDIIEKNKCRFKNTKINYTKLAKILGCSNHTAKNKCEYYGIK